MPRPTFATARETRRSATSNNQHPWELCTTMAGGVWGYKPNAKVKTRDETIRLLVSVVGRDGNLLLNVGPRPDGQIDPEQAQVCGMLATG